MSEKLRTALAVKANGLLDYLLRNRGGGRRTPELSAKRPSGAEGGAAQIDTMLRARVTGSRNPFDWVIRNKRRAELLGVQAEKRRQGLILQAWARDNVRYGTKGMKLDPVTKRLVADPGYIANKR